MKQQRNERLILLLTSLASMGMLIENVIMGWEIWVTPILIVGTVSLWVVYIAQKPEYDLRVISYSNDICSS